MGDSVKKPGWKDIPIGGRIEDAGNSQKYYVGGWRTRRPVWIKENCIHCLFCWVACPDAAIVVEDGKIQGFDYDHCKGCGICARECPAKSPAIQMRSENIEDQFDS